MELTEEHYQKLLGLNSPWEVTNVDLSLEKMSVDIFVKFNAEHACCPKCAKQCKIYDHQAQRSWRHLDTMQFITELHSSTPRTECSEHGVLNIDIPWSQKRSGFTLLFEEFAIKVLQASRSTQEACKLLGINWHQCDAIKKRAVKRGLERRKQKELPWLGVDEKAFKKGHKYVSILNDIEGGRVIDVVEGRRLDSAKELINKGLNSKQQNEVCAVAMDMWPAYMSAVKELLPDADIVHDRFHVSKYLNDAVDKTRKIEHAKLRKENNEILKGLRYLFLRNSSSFSSDEEANFNELCSAQLEVTKAWGLKELFINFWESQSVAEAKDYFNHWYEKVIESSLIEMRRVGETLKAHLEGLLNYFKSYISNGVSEGLNSKIQTVKSNARGYRSFESFRTNILFYCGKLELAP